MNPKHIRAQKESKSRLELIPWTGMDEIAAVLEQGADKYGERNWRIDKIMTSTYEGAILRHFSAWSRGDTFDDESNCNHLAHIAACCLIMLDAEEYGCLIDDRSRSESFDLSDSADGNDNAAAIERYHLMTAKEQEQRVTWPRSELTGEQDNDSH